MAKKVSPQALTDALRDTVKIAVGKELVFNHAFQRTQRRNGDVVEASPSPRDTVDEGDFRDRLFVKTLSGYNRSKWTIEFGVEYAESVLDTRPELIEEIVADIVANGFANDMVALAIGEAIVRNKANSSRR